MEDVLRLKDAAAEFGDIAVLMNNAGIEMGGKFFSPLETWKRIIDVNLWGAIHGVQAFVPDMIASGRPGLVINTGSKQGITTPPGNTPYNVSKAGLKVMTEALAHELRGTLGCTVTAHLLIPGFVFTGLTRARGVGEKPSAAWTPEQTIDFMLASLERGDFYILCPDNDVERATDEKRIRWSAEDIVENRSALSRWDERYKAAFDAYMQG
jgi:NAD(P)-dependent dehydrogenase (short-subunit alcohol dehydrogenase family)